MRNVYEQVDRNKTRSVITVTLSALFVGLTVYLLGSALGYGQSFIGVALIISGLTSFLGYWYSDKIILAISGARPANAGEDRLFHQVAENLSIAASLPLPKLYVIEDSAPNAFATGRATNRAVVCVTTGLLDKLNRTELEGVIGHELSHIRNYDMLLMSIVTVLLGTVTLLSDWLLRSSWHRDGRRDRGGNSLFIVGLATALLAPLIGQLIKLTLSRRREFLADAGSVMLTRQPSGLISALEKISHDGEPLEAANKATANLYIVNPFEVDTLHGRKVDRLAGFFNTHPPVADRIAALKQMQ